MEKPDFEQYSIDNAGDSSISRRVANGIQKGCEHVWSTHVVPLQETEKDLRILLTERTRQLTESTKLKQQAESENKLLREEIESLKEQLLEEGERDGN